MTGLHLPRGTAAEGPWAVRVAPGRPGWAHTSLRVLELVPGGAQSFATGREEAVVLPLAGAAVVHADGVAVELRGRSSVFDRVSDFAYVPRDCEVRITSTEGGRFAVAGAVCEPRLTPRHGAAEDVAVELRGA